jgi:trk system potassium uptake protein TrkH
LFWGKRHRVTLQAKLGLSTTAVLLGVGFCAFLGFEWTNTLSHLSLVDKLHNAWFQSITPRTAGFNSIDTTQLSTPSRLLFIVLMFIGGGPGGTAGGIKTTTFAILTLAIVAALRGQSRVTAFGARLPLETVSRATAIATLGIGAVVFSTFALLLTQVQSFDGLLFEAVSALGTVGLSLGVTPKLDTIGKVIIMACMFAGRVGPLTLLLFLGSSARTDPNTLPERDVQVG